MSDEEFDDDKNCVKVENVNNANSNNSGSNEGNEGVINCNPSQVDTDESDNEILLGDAIEGTLYSARFVLNTLLKLKSLEESLEKDRQFEDELCYLWDMTMEQEVINFLLEQGVLEIFAEYIKNSDDKRLIEILVGIIANMCSIKDTCAILLQKKDVLSTILSLFACSDVLTLIQTGRLLHTMLCKLNTEESLELYKIFPDASVIKSIYYILYNSVHDTLLETTMETLNAILRNWSNIVMLDTEIDKNKFYDCIPNVEDVIECTIEAFQTLLPQTNDEMRGDTHFTTKDTRRMTLFLSIQETLTLFVNEPVSTYSLYVDSLCDCFVTIGSTLLRPEPILPVKTFEFDAIETIAGMLKFIEYPFDSQLLDCILQIWWKLLDGIETESDEFGDCSTPEEDEEKILLLQNLRDIITETILKMDDVKMKEFLQNTTNTIEVLLRTEMSLNTDPRIAECVNKVKEQLHQIEQVGE
ncbi:protein saal1 [Teleopsis dalmanni]|uniref:protein saal1 n=1 Tax=Teleopsis dalmanni TaxID=139649 RepID=UPI000D32BD21|nr:protein saal1 [Teleopsis dalmanni]